MNKLYGELAAWWPLLSPVADYAEEAAFFSRLLMGAGIAPGGRVLELGSGGGNNAFHLKRHFAMTLVDPSSHMLEHSRAINPECEHLIGDMRDLRLSRQFDAVFVHDAVVYMTSEADLRQAMETAFVHTRPGGAALFAPDYLTENFRAGTDQGGVDDGDRGLRFLEWVHDPNPNDRVYAVDYAILLKEHDGTVRVEHDRHLEGLFSRNEWLTWLRETGYQSQTVALQHSEVEPGAHELFICHRPKSGS
jgi:SAM-dependent methyltransferase